MGLKRSYDEDLQELYSKHPKQLDFSEQLSLLAESSPYRDSQKADIRGEAVGISWDTPVPPVSKDEISNDFSDSNGIEFETSVPISWATGSISEEDIGSEAVWSSSFPVHYEFNFPCNQLVQFADAYSSLLNSSPRKKVPIGPDYQAAIPAWDPRVIKENSKIFTCSSDVNYIREEANGAFVIPIADSPSSSDVGKTEVGEPECSCVDDGSVRCVKQHIKDARKKLQETIGHENFVSLGFLDMGEEVAKKWTEEEEHVFHEVVYSNPVSHGKNFWVQLSTVFPSRTKQELVSYYFNVFMLRKLAVQNRSRWLDIDSDDDEWKENCGPFGVTGEDKYSAAVSFINSALRFDFGEGVQNEYDDSSSDDDDDIDDDDCNDNDNGDGNSQAGGVDAAVRTDGKYYTSKGKTEDTCDGCRFDLTDSSLGRAKEFLDVHED